jgi:hypothetical protein
MSIDLSALSNFTTSAQGLSNLILVSPQKIVGYQPQTQPTDDGSIPVQPPKFLFNYEGENVVNLDSDITDHFVEDNTAIQDQIALTPEIITTQGFIGEVNNVVPEELEVLKIAAQKLEALGAYAPALTTTALLAYNSALQLYQTAQGARNAAVSSWSSISGQGGQSVITGTETAEELAQIRNQTQAQTKQQVAFNQFYGYWRSRTLFTVQTPWAIFKNMAIKSFKAVQDGETDQVTTFEVTFKLMRFAEARLAFSEGESVTFDNNNAQGRAFDQGAPEVDLGTSTPTSSISLTSALPA